MWTLNHDNVFQFNFITRFLFTHKCQLCSCVQSLFLNWILLGQKEQKERIGWMIMTDRKLGLGKGNVGVCAYVCLCAINYIQNDRMCTNTYWNMSDSLPVGRNDISRVLCHFLSPSECWIVGNNGCLTNQQWKAMSPVCPADRICVIMSWQDSHWVYMFSIYGILVH